MKKNIILVFFLLLILKSGFLQAKTNELNGNWYFEIDTKGIGNVRTIMACTSDGVVFNAATLSTASGMGSLAKITDGTISGNEITGTLLTASGRFHLKGEYFGDSLNAKLYNKQKNISGYISGNKTKLLLPLTDYGKIVENIFTSAQEHIFDAEMLQMEVWKNFERTIISAGKSSNDDIDLVFSFYMNAMKIPVSHLYLFKETKIQNEKKDADSEMQNTANTYEIKNYDNKTAYLKIASLGGEPEEIDSLFKIILESDSKNLILDLRDNPGGNLAAGLRTAQYLAEFEQYGGIFLTRAWFDKNKGKKIPVLNDYPNYNSISIANNKTFDDMIHSNEALTIKLIPLKEKFTGRLFILINNNTGSTCEPLIAGLKQNKNTTVIGKKSAGKMMQSKKYSVGEGFILTLPTSDFYTPEGTRLEGNGVKPTIETDSDKALEYVLNLVK